MTTPIPSLQDLQRALRHSQAQAPAERLRHLVSEGLDRWPLPASGDTLARWRALAEVGSDDLSLVKFFEGHLDALAILQELGCASPIDAGTWGVWAAEAPGARVTVSATGAGELRLHGSKPWCSGAAVLDAALLTAWHADGTGPQLVAVKLAQPQVTVDPHSWHAVGMAPSASLTVSFDGAGAWPVGGPGDYLSRPGFWHGGAGIAACWHGGACALADALRRATPPAGAAPGSASASAAFRLAALGKVDTALAATAALLRHTAQWIDAHPREPAQAPVLRARLAVEACALQVLHEAGRSLGAKPFCHDAAFARMAADLPVYLRQSHAERDFAALGEHSAASASSGWAL